jgi:ribosomal protein S14
MASTRSNKGKRSSVHGNKGRCSKCGREDIISEGLCRPCRRADAKGKRDLVVGETYGYDELSEMFGVEINEDSRIVVID